MISHPPRLRVTEVYLSIQGESTWAGLPCVFIRLTGCPLRCVWCDTVYSFTEGSARDVIDVVDAACSYDVPVIEITGGEPLVQPHCGTLAQALLDRGKTVLIETSGAYDLDLVPRDCIRIMDLKCPDSGEQSRNRWENLAILQPHDEIKFVLASRQDYEWALDVTCRHDLASKVRCVLFSPAYGLLPAENLAAWMIADKPPVRMQLQMHKYIWDPQARGV